MTAGHERQEHAARPTLLWVARARRREIEEECRPLDVNPTPSLASTYWPTCQPVHLFFSPFGGLGQTMM